ncbi:MAG: N-acetyl-gamma-glutamyl-phosphate reductase [Gammaproteobacteria bacterium]|nr:N-acetyl-gamma-glutamyl-phosphate reductase [Gammaproteobacteria bacterium]
MSAVAPDAQIPAVVLGGSGYVAGELLRLIAGHPRFALAAVLSESQPGEPLARAFPHLASTYREASFATRIEVQKLLSETPQAALFSAAPHGIAAGLIDSLLGATERAGAEAHVVDISADFRYPTAEAYRAVYGAQHGAPARLAQFTCALPEHLERAATPHVAHPGCFASAMLLAAAPLLACGAVAPTIYVSGVTGSTGSGRRPVEGTHHPLRHADLHSYNALAHRHVPEVAACLRATTGVEARIAFVPHSGPFARGIHVTLQASATRALETRELNALLADFYARAPFVQVTSEAPRVKNVVGSNYAHLMGVARAGSVAVMCTLDNLTKGAAGGAVQWMNRLFGLPETAGLTAPAPGWT